MSLDVREIVEALPAGAEAEPTPHEALHDLLTRLSNKPVPVGALHRMWSMGTVQAKIALGYLAYWIRSGYRTTDENERRLNETHLASAIKLLAGMSYLRGMMAKIGQALANYPHMVPAQYAELLGHLHFDAPPMHYSLLREHLRNELGKDPEELFARFDRHAFAAASLGQVHRATLPSGEAVAVKVQYPNIAKTIRSDFRAMMALLMPMLLSKDWDNIRAQWDDIRQMLEWETDYEREASFLTRARSLFRADENIVVPRVYEGFSTKRVLTMEYVDGVHIDRYLAGNPTQAERDRFGSQIMRASFRIAHSGRLWYADSQPGNLIFLRDGRLGVIDFGCCREFSEEEWDYYREMLKAAENPKNDESFRRAMVRTIGLGPEQDMDDAYFSFLAETFRWFNAYITREGPYDFSDEAQLRFGIDMVARVAKHRYFRSLPVNTWINRHLFGLRAILFRLGARVAVRPIYLEESGGLID